MEPHADHLRVPEILAPAGGREQFYAALNAGADAVYLGLKAFNARARAENFTADDLHELVPLAHAYGMKVNVTVNILVKDAELGDLVRTLGAIEEAGADAIIVQDLAVARIARAYFPGLRLHASTQMAVHNLAGVLKAKELGFRRVVLARELTALELRKIRAAVPREEVELEAFCHGSLCYSYSGLCFFSGAGDARSGNRGECAYTCRQPYKIVSEPGHGFLFSMRDLDTAESLDLLVKAGVDTLKIEGRKKDAQYVASTVRLYRQRLDEVFGRPTLRGEAPGEAVALGASDKANPVAVRDDLALSFHRQRTAFFLKGRYHENVIDLDNPTHAGVKVGEIMKVAGRRVSVVSEVALERFDGLRVKPAERAFHALPQNGAQVTVDPELMRKKYENDHVEFSLREMAVGGKRVAEAPAGAEVTIEWPQDAPLPAEGDVLHKVRSADLKRRIAALAVPPKDARVRPLRLVDVRLVAEPAGELLRLAARAERFGELVAEAEAAVPLQKSSGKATLEGDLRAAFALLGDAGFAARDLTFAGEGDWFVPRSLVKKLKQQLAQALPEAYDRFISGRTERALKAVVTPLAPAAAGKGARRFSVKTDRLETLDEIVRYAKEHADFALDEVVFEPKRAFLPELDPKGLAETLAALDVPVRLAMPTVIRAWDEPLLARWFKVAAEHGITRLEVGNLGAFQLLDDWGLRRAGLDLATDFTLYSLNSAATRLWRELGAGTVCLSIEDDHESLKHHLQRLTPAEREGTQAILYKDTPLFIAEACSLTALHDGCPTSKVCGYRTLEIENPKGERFYVAHESCKSIVYGKEAYSVTHRQDALQRMGVTRFRLDFLTRAYDAAALRQVLDAARKGAPVAGTHAANFDRTLL